ncbi:F-box protein At2g16365 [Linum grandiflorum]
MSNGKEEISGNGGGSQSSWIGHWLGRSSRVGSEATAEAAASVTNEVSEEIDHGVKCHHLFDLSGKGSDGCGERLRDLGKRKMADLASGSGTSTRDGLERLRNEPSEGQPYLMLGVSLDEEIPLRPVKKRVESHLPSSAALVRSSEMGTRVLPQRNGLGVFPSRGYLSCASPQVVPYEFDCRRNGVQCAPEVGISSWDRTKKTGFDGSLSVQDPSTSKNEARGFAANQAEGDTQAFRSSHGLPGMPASGHGVQAMRIRTTIDSVTEFPAGCAKVSHTTHHFFITKKTDVDEGQMFQQSSISTKFKGKSIHELFGLKPDHRSRNNQGVKLQQLDSSTESEGKEDTETVEAYLHDSKNGSSSETNTMDLDAAGHNQLRGLASQPSSKDMQGVHKSPISQDLIASVGQEVTGRMVRKLLPDINEEFFLHPDASGTADDKETSTSITQSLDVECMLTHPDNSTNPDPVRIDPCSRWVRRLKPRSSGLLPYSYGSKGSDLGEASHGKVNRVFTKMISNAPIGNDLPSFNYPAILSERNPESTSTDFEVKAHGVEAHSHPWIRRWSRANPVASPRRKADCVMASESRVRKGTSSDAPEKQFPSIGAMALMGKAMTGFQPCEFRKRGCLIVWSTKGY